MFGNAERVCDTKRATDRTGGGAARFKGAFLAGILFALGSPSLAAAETLNLGGTGGDLGTLRVLGDAYERLHPGVTVNILPSLGSGGGIRAVIDGAIDLSISSRPVKDEERANGAQSTPYAETALVFVVAEGVPYTDITTSEVVDIYLGNRDSWPDGSAVRPVLRPANDGDAQILASTLDGMREALAKAEQEHMPIAGSDQENADIIESRPGGFGFISLSLILAENSSLRPLALDGVVASTETIRLGTYPIIKSFYLVIGPTVSDLASDFVAFMNSSEGVDILRRTGHLAIPIRFE